jgi:hypothetical protein
MVVFAAAAAVIIAAAIAIPRLGGSQGGPAQASVSIVLHATTAAKVFGAATGQATARQDASGSWDITLTVQHLKSFGDTQWYECWTPTGFVDTIRSGTMVYEERTGSGTGSQEVHPGV